MRRSGVGLADSGFVRPAEKGFIAPWNPPAELIIAGPYRYVRNPMISGVGFMLLGEVMLFINDGLAVWFLLFATVNAVYIPLVEEPQLLKRFGTAYALYRAEVPRWIPRLHPWSGEVLEAKEKNKTGCNAGFILGYLMQPT